ncbi:MAG: NAD(P)H-hydrate dehydratase [Lachnospiraceae bacterium]|nr:NAD(P)H-hydrate dehydratase [Lachnospiraceae bacterium]
MNLEYLKIEEVAKLIPDRIKESHKGTYGKVCLLGGAVEYSGAIRLSALAYASLKSGAGLSTVAVPRFLVPIVSNNILEVMIYPIDSTEKEIVFNRENIDGLINKFDVLTIGMGLGRSEEATKIVNYIIENYKGKLVLDADALYIVSKNISILNKSKAKIILTPHLLEFKRLYEAAFENDTFEIKSELINDDEIKKYNNYKIDKAVKFVKSLNVTLLLKGVITFVVAKRINDDDIISISAIDRGTPGMATAGSGDVLSGIITGFLGYMDDGFDVARVSAFVNGLAGELAAKDEGEISMTSSDTIRHIGEAIRLILSNK